MSFRLLTEVCTIREYEVIQVIFVHNNGLGRHYTIVCADTPDKYSPRVVEFDENLRFSSSIEEWELLAILESMKSEDLIEEL